MKIKFNADDDLPLKKTLKLYNMVIDPFFMRTTIIPAVFKMNVCIRNKCQNIIGLMALKELTK